MNECIINLSKSVTLRDVILHNWETVKLANTKKTSI